MELWSDKLESHCPCNFLLMDQLSKIFYIECAYKENLEMIPLLKLGEFGKEEDKEERSEHEKETEVPSLCAYLETDGLRVDKIMAVQSDFQAGHSTYHYYTFFLICRKGLPP